VTLSGWPEEAMPHGFASNPCLANPDDVGGEDLADDLNRDSVTLLDASLTAQEDLFQYESITE
jgi:hypothetical protein